MGLMYHAIEITNASFSYDKKKVFKNVSLTVNKGEIFCLMGRNGCGKSTIIDAILGINHISEGSIKISCKDVNSYSASDLAKHVAYVPQHFEKSFPYTVQQIILMGRTVHAGPFGTYNERDYEITEQVMKDIGVYHLKDRPYINVSGGEMQMVMLARALVQETEIIIMDEPTAHLDYYNELLFLENVIKLVKDKDKTILMATHSPNQPFFMGSNSVPIRVGLMKDGSITKVGSPSSVLTIENIKGTYSVKSHIASVGSLKAVLPVNTIVGGYASEK